jgi:hypothetical protein
LQEVENILASTKDEYEGQDGNEERTNVCSEYEFAKAAIRRPEFEEIRCVMYMVSTAPVLVVPWYEEDLHSTVPKTGAKLCMNMDDVQQNLHLDVDAERFVKGEGFLC